jgi:periplasmic protein TonB
MKFVFLKSRGGDYLVVAENVAWLRSAENGQTNVGMVGGDPLVNASVTSLRITLFCSI